jgi:tripartite-type tricarboxylate transporter receptor subunit TctC
VNKPALAALCVAALFTSAHAQTWPAKTVRIIVPYPPGGGTDTAARLVAQKLGESLNRNFVVENRPGANGNMGTEAAARAAPDGYTLGMATPGPVTAGKSLYANLPYDPQRDFAPVILINASPNVLAVHPSMPARTLKELVALAKARPLRVGVSTVASIQHLLAEMLAHESKVKLEVITYKGGAQVATDVVGGQIESLWSVLPVVLPFIQGNRLRPLAIASEKRSALLAGVPTTAEAGYAAVVATAWNGLVAPAGTPKPVIDTLSAEINRALKTPDIQERFAAIGMEAVGGTPESFAAFLRTETAKWSGVIKAANIRLE